MHIIPEVSLRRRLNVFDARPSCLRSSRWVLGRGDTDLAEVALRQVLLRDGRAPRAHELPALCRTHREDRVRRLPLLGDEFRAGNHEGGAAKSDRQLQTGARAAFCADRSQGASI